MGPVGLYNWLNHCQFPIMWPPWTVLFSKLVKNMQETRYLQTLSKPRAATINTRELNNGIINWEKCCSHIPGHSQTQKHTFCKFHTVQSPQLTLREFIAVKTISAPPLSSDRGTSRWDYNSRRASNSCHQIPNISFNLPGLPKGSGFTAGNGSYCDF